MRRKSTRNAQKASPDKAVETPPAPRTRRSRRRKRSPSQSNSDSEAEVILPAKQRLPPTSQAPPDTTTKSHSPSDEETSSQEAVWKVTPTESPAMGSGEIQKLKICLRRPVSDSSSPEKNSRASSRRNKSASGGGSSHTEDDATTSSEDRGNRSHHSHVTDEETGKGKSTGKHKSKIERSVHLNESDAAIVQTSDEVLGNAPQVTHQSPSSIVDDAGDHDSVRESDVSGVVVSNNKKPVDDSDDDEPLIAIKQNAVQENSSVSQDKENELSTGEVATEQEDQTSEQVQPEVREPEITRETVGETAEQAPEDTSDNLKLSEEQQQQQMEVVVEEKQSGEDTNLPNSEQEDKSTCPEPEKVNGQQVQVTKSEPEVTRIRRKDRASAVEARAKTPEVKQQERDADAKESRREAPKKRRSLRRTMEAEVAPPTPELQTSPPVEQVEEKTYSPKAPKSSPCTIKLNRDRDISAILEAKNDSSSQQPPREDQQEEQSESTSSVNDTKKPPTKRKRQWDLKSTDALLPPLLPKIDLEVLQSAVPTPIEFPKEADLTLVEKARERRRSSLLNRSKSEDMEKNNSHGGDRKVSMSDERPSMTEDDEEAAKEDDRTSNIIAFNRKISIVDDTASKMRPPPSPARHPTSEVLYITSLVRPFTVKQLKELLERTGKIKEDGFWTDRIKSKCYAHYESVEEAEATRNALHGVQWPIGNGKKLIIDYATAEDLEKAKNPAPAPVIAAELPVVEATKTSIKENVEPPTREDDRRGRDADRDHDKEREREKKRNEAPVREWDIGKREMQRDRSRSKERTRKHRRSPSPRDDYMSRKQRKIEESVPQKMMDDLFLKTVATPSIYWQPLSPEEIHLKQQQRLVRMEEHKRRMEETTRFRGREMGRGGYRRRYD